jgi:hypothetical protein
LLLTIVAIIYWMVASFVGAVLGGELGIMLGAIVALLNRSVSRRQQEPKLKRT